MPLNRALITAFGSHGDVLPFVALGRSLQRRGVDVVLQTNPYFSEVVENAGLVLLPAGTRDDYHRFFGQPIEGNPRRAMAQVAAEVMDTLAPAHHALRRMVLPGRTIAIGGSLGFVHRLLSDTDDLPCVTAHLAPSALRSNESPPLLAPEWDAWRRMASPMLNRLAWWLMDATFGDVHFTRPLNRVRKRLGLAAVDHALGAWLQQVDVLLGLFPRWFATPPTDWPAGLKLVGFPMQDGDGRQALPPHVDDFLNEGCAPVVFAPGTANGAAQDFFRASVQACLAAGQRGVLVSHFADQLPSPLPPNMIHAQYVPFGTLLPHAAAFVHHGGIGSVAQALKAGVPQLIRPVAYDQFDNADRIQRMGVGRVILPRHYTHAGVARELRSLLNDAALRERCRELRAQVLAQGDAPEAAADAVLAVMQRSRHSPGRVQAATG